MECVQCVKDNQHAWECPGASAGSAGVHTIPHESTRHRNARARVYASQGENSCGPGARAAGTSHAYASRRMRKHALKNTVVHDSHTHEQEYNARFCQPVSWAKAHASHIHRHFGVFMDTHETFIYTHVIHEHAG
jgi:hypothetical protein